MSHQKQMFTQKDPATEKELDHLYKLKRRADELIDEKNKSGGCPWSWVIRYCEITKKIEKLEQVLSK